MFTYSYKGAVVTGAGGGIGLQTALDLLNEGVQVLAIDLKSRPEELRSFNDGQCMYQQIDLTDPTAIQSAVNKAEKQFSGIGYLERFK